MPLYLWLGLGLDVISQLEESKLNVCLLNIFKEIKQTQTHKNNVQLKIKRHT